MNRSILLLGATGQVGRAIAKLLLSETPHDVVLASRHLPACRALAAELLSVPSSLPTTLSPAARLSVRAVDATVPTEFREALEGVGTVVVAAPIGEKVGSVARVALERGVDWIDLLHPRDASGTLTTMDADVARTGLTWVTRAGLHAGLPVALARSILDRDPGVTRVDVHLLMSLSTLASDSLVADVLHGGGRRDGPALPNGRTFDFGRFGRRRCVRLGLPELADVSQDGRRAAIAAWGTGLNRATEGLPMRLAARFAQAGGPAGARLATRGLGWLTDRFAHAPFGAIAQAQGWTPEGDSIRLRVEHSDVLALAAATAVACLSQVLDGTAGHLGVRPMGLCVDPAELIADLRRLGCAVDCRRASGTPLSIKAAPAVG